MPKHLTKQALFFYKEKILCRHQLSDPLLPTQATIQKLNLIILNSYLDNSITIIQCQIDLLPEALLARGYLTVPIKDCLSANKPIIQAHILRAYHCLNWHIQSQYCGHCGTALKIKINNTEKTCPSCTLSFFPRFSPAILVLIQKEEQILLARSHHFRPGVYSAIAGFIEMGESAEQAAHREVKEELNLNIINLRYFGSQTWPFPDNFMIAFTAQYHSGDIKIDSNEIEDAQWFKLTNLPQLPYSASIARQLIDSIR